MLELQETGFTYRGEQWHIACLGVKGDLPFLRTAGGFTRHWQRAVRTQGNTAPHGVCFLCLAGTVPGGGFEDFNVDARWSTIGTVEPWTAKPSLLRLFHCVDKPHDYFKTDVWHNYHGGAGRTFIASVLTECLSLLPGSKESKISHMNDYLHLWAKRPGCKLPHSGPFVSERIGLTSFQVVPEGSWSKFADTYVYHKFVEWFMTEKREQFRGDAYFEMMFEAVQTINATFSTLYCSGLWQLPNEAHACGTGGRRWLELYARLAHKCYVDRRQRFPIYVKFHMLDHQFRRILAGSKLKWCYNVLAESVQQDEVPCLFTFYVLRFFCYDMS